MKFYVAGKWQDRRSIQRLQQALTVGGHEITVDWTGHVNPKSQSVLQEWAIRDVEGVLDCDTYIGIFTNGSNGALVELGVALGLGKRVWIIGNAIDTCIFLSHPLVTKFLSTEAMLKVLDNMPKE